MPAGGAEGFMFELVGNFVADKASRAASQLNHSAASVTSQTSRIRERVRSFASDVAKIRA